MNSLEHSICISLWKYSKRKKKILISKESALYVSYSKQQFIRTEMQKIISTFLMSVIINDINFVYNYSRKIFADAKNMCQHSFALLYNSVNCLLSFAPKYVNITQNSHFFVVCPSSSNVIRRGKIFHRIDLWSLVPYISKGSFHVLMINPLHRLKPNT